MIPAIRSILAQELIKRGYSQKDIGEVLGISVAEVNYLIKGKRGDLEIKKELENDEDFVDLVNSFVNKLVNEKDSEDTVISLCPLCSYARRKVLKQDSACPYDI